MDILYIFVYTVHIYTGCVKKERHFKYIYKIVNNSNIFFEN